MKHKVNLCNTAALLFLHTTVQSQAIDSELYPPIMPFTYKTIPGMKLVSGRGTTVCNIEDNKQTLPSFSDSFDETIALVTDRFAGNGQCYPWSGNSNADYLIQKSFALQRKMGDPRI